MVNASILVVAVNGNGVMSGKILTVSEGKLEVKADATPVSANGGSVTVQITTNIDYEVVIPETAKSWVTLVQTKALRTDKVTFSVAPNTEASQRTAEIEVRVDGAKVQTFNIVQQGKAVVEDKWEKADLETMYPDGNLSYASNNPETIVSGKGWKGSNIYLYNNTTLGWHYKDGTTYNQSYTVGLSGNIGSPGSIVSPNLSGGCSAIRLLYGFLMTGNNYKSGISINIKITNTAGDELFNQNVTIDYDATLFKAMQWEVLSETFDNLSISGDFIITVTNNCPWGKSSNFKDISDILEISWKPLL